MPGSLAYSVFLPAPATARAALLGPVRWFYARSLALCVGQRFSAPNPRYGEARRRALCRGLASPLQSWSSLHRSPAASGGVDGCVVDRCLPASVLQALAQLGCRAFLTLVDFEFCSICWFQIRTTSLLRIRITTTLPEQPHLVHLESALNAAQLLTNYSNATTQRGPHDSLCAHCGRRRRAAS